MTEKIHINQGLIEKYILGLTTEVEGKEVEVYLSKNPKIAKEIRESQSSLIDLAKEYGIQPKKRKEELFISESVVSKERVETSTDTSIRWGLGIIIMVAIGFGLAKFLL